MKNSKIHDIMNLAAYFPFDNMTLYMPDGETNNWASCAVERLNDNYLVSVLSDYLSICFVFVDLVTEPVQIFVYNENQTIREHIVKREKVKRRYKLYGKQCENIVIECLYHNNLPLPTLYLREK